MSKTGADNHSPVGDATEEAVMVAANDSSPETPAGPVEEEDEEPQSTRVTRSRAKGGNRKG